MKKNVRDSDRYQWPVAFIFSVARICLRQRRIVIGAGQSIMSSWLLKQLEGAVVL
jgi:hypothetical protein